MGAQPYTPPTTTNGRTQFATAAAKPSSSNSKGAAANGRRLNQLFDAFHWTPSCWYCFNPRVSRVCGMGREGHDLQRVAQQLDESRTTHGCPGFTRFCNIALRSHRLQCKGRVAFHGRVHSYRPDCMYHCSQV
jgi:hypothetical protein